MCNFLHPGWLDPLYKPHFICLGCRKGFKVRDAEVDRFWARFHGRGVDKLTEALPSRSIVGARCPACRDVMQPVCACFEVPRRTQLRRWKQLRERFGG